MVTALVSTIVASSIISGNLSAHSGVLNKDVAARMKVMSEIAKNINPSERGELEISSIIRFF